MQEQENKSMVIEARIVAAGRWGVRHETSFWVLRNVSRLDLGGWFSAGGNFDPPGHIWPRLETSWVAEGGVLLEECVEVRDAAELTAMHGAAPHPHPPQELPELSGSKCQVWRKPGLVAVTPGNL